MSAHPQQPDRIAELDGVRGIAILFVLAMHGLYIGPLLGLDVMAHPYARIAWLGWAGVDVFFVLSGFLITGILLRSKDGPHRNRYFRNFYVRRALRIFPLYYLVIVLLLYVLQRPEASADAKLSYLLYYQNIRYALVGERLIDPARLITWSLAIEEQFYLVWPAVVWFASRRALRIVCLLMIAGAIASHLLLLQNGFEHTHFLTPCRMDALAAGALIAVLPTPRAAVGALIGYVATLLGIAGLVATAYATGASTPESLGQQRWGLFAALSLGVGFVHLARSRNVLSPVFRFDSLRAFGKYSYCIYLTHMLVVEWLSYRLLATDPETVVMWRDRLTPVGCVIVFTVLAALGSLLVAAVSWHVFEKWFLRLKRYFPSVT
ncbi:MAG: acyltransferase family protein [Planctomycetota bacterium]